MTARELVVLLFLVIIALFEIGVIIALVWFKVFRPEETWLQIDWKSFPPDRKSDMRDKLEELRATMLRLFESIDRMLRP